MTVMACMTINDTEHNVQMCHHLLQFFRQVLTLNADHIVQMRANLYKKTCMDLGCITRQQKIITLYLYILVELERNRGD